MNPVWVALIGLGVALLVAGILWPIGIAHSALRNHLDKDEAVEYWKQLERRQGERAIAAEASRNQLIRTLLDIEIRGRSSPSTDARACAQLATHVLDEVWKDRGQQ